MFIKLSGFPLVKPQVTTTLIGLDGGKNVQILVNEIVSILNLNLVTGSKGQAVPTTNPLTPKNGDYYIANGPGTYTNFKNSSNVSIQVLSSDALAYFIYNGTYWTKQVVTIDISTKADASALAALDADVYRKAYIDAINNMATSPTTAVPADRTSSAYPSSIVTATFFGEFTEYTGADGRSLVSIKVKTYVAGTFTVGLFRLVSGTATLVAKQNFTSTGAGVVTIPRASFTATDITAAEAGGKLYYAISFGTGGITKYIDNGSGGTSWSCVGSIVTSATATTANYNFSWWIEVTGLYSPLLTAVTNNTATVAAHTISISANTSKINNINNMVSGVSLIPPGRSAGLPVATNNVVNTYYFGEYANSFNPTTSPLSKIYVRTRGAGSFHVGFFRITGLTNFVKLAEKSFTATAAGVMTISLSDLSGIDTTFPGESLVYIGTRAAATNVLSFYDTGVAQTGWGHTPYTDASGTLITNGYYHDTWTEVGGAEISPIVEAVKQLQSNSVSGEINLINCSKIVCIGDSYTESYYALKQKSWINILSSFMDWNFENYGISGFNMVGLINNLRANTAYYEGVPPRDYNGTYAIIASHTNDYTAGYISAANHLETWLNNLRTLCRIVKSLGMIPVICSEWVNIAIPNGTASYSDLIGTSLSIMANEEGGMYIDVLYKAEPMQGNLNTPFYGGNHPGTRSNGLVWWTLLNKLREYLPRPKTSLKLFKVRSTVTVSTVADLYFKDNLERAKLFQEIQVSENRIADAHANYYDDLDTWVALGAGRLTTKESEYLKLRKGTTISMSAYSLISCVLPTTKNNILSLSLTISETTVAVYYKDVLNDVWVSVSNVSGVITLSAADIAKGIDYDKVSFLLFKSGGFNLTSAKVNYTGIGDKDLNFTKRKEVVELSTTELLTNTTVSSLTNWIVSGTLTPSIDANGVLPAGITRYVDLTTANWLKQTVTFASSPVRRKMQIKATVRTFPIKFVYTDTYPTNSVIKSDTYDFATLEISVYKNTNNIAYSSKNVVPLWNTEIIIECDIPPNITTLDIGFRSTDKTIQFMSASVKI